MSDAPKVGPETLAAQAMGDIDEVTRAIVGPVHLSTTFERRADNSFVDGRGYARADSPAFDAPERLLARLEGGASAMLFASGMAAATAPFAVLVPGDHVLVPRVMYWGLRKWLATFAVTWGIDVELVDMTDLTAVAAALRPGRTRLVWVETPANPTWAVSDIAALAELAHRAHARLVVDATVLTPVLCRPLELGADLVMHAATKYLNGHSDVLAGALVTARDDPYWERLRAWRREQGSVMGSFEAWLLLRGMRTLFVRVRRQSATAQTVAEWARTHPAVAEVLYPGLPDHSGHDIAARQMTGGFGGMLSVRVHGGEATAVAVAAQVRVFVRATSLGGTESLIEHRASIEGPSTPVPADLLRLSIGLEEPEDLIADLDQALSAVVLPRSEAPAGASSGSTGAPLANPPSVGPNRRRIDGGEGPPEGVRAMVIARGGDLTAEGPIGSPGAWAPLVDAPPPAELDTGAHAESDAGAVQVQDVLDTEINPAVAAHGGRIELAGIEDGVIRLRLTGGCQGCALAEVTVHQGVGPRLRQLAGITAVVDVTDHPAGTAPYLKPAKR